MTRTRQTFEDWHCELRCLYDLAESKDISGEHPSTVLITTVIRDRNVRSTIFGNLRTPILDDTV